MSSSLSRALPARAVVTGASGFLGRHIADLFRARGVQVTELVRPRQDRGQDRSPVDREALPDQLRLPTADWGDAIARIVPDVIVHCAGSSSVGGSMTDPASDFAAGPALTFALLDAIRTSAPDCAFVFCSSAAVYGDPVSLPIHEDHAPRPLSPYGFHKLQSEMLCREFSEVYGIATAALRIFSAYGPGLERQVVWDICQRAAASDRLTLHGTGRETRDFVHARDVAQAAWLVATSAALRGECYNVGTGEEIAIADLARAIVARLGKPDSWIIFNGTATPGNPVNWCADIARLRSLGFAPTVSLDQGLASVLACMAHR